MKEKMSGEQAVQEWLESRPEVASLSDSDYQKLSSTMVQYTAANRTDLALEFGVSPSAGLIEHVYQKLSGLGPVPRIPEPRAPRFRIRLHPRGGATRFAPGDFTADEVQAKARKIASSTPDTGIVILDEEGRELDYDTLQPFAEAEPGRLFVLRFSDGKYYACTDVHGRPSRVADANYAERMNPRRAQATAASLTAAGYSVEVQEA